MIVVEHLQKSGVMVLFCHSEERGIPRKDLP